MKEVEELLLPIGIIELESTIPIVYTIRLLPYKVVLVMDRA